VNGRPCAPERTTTENQRAVFVFRNHGWADTDSVDVMIDVAPRVLLRAVTAFSRLTTKCPLPIVWVDTVSIWFD
jgi:hypothetical protein